MNKINMLSAKNVKIHGMQSRRWTTKDKITQYKGLINLYKRDQKIIEFDTNVEHKKQYKILKQLRSHIETDRIELDNAIRGDRQKLRNTLAEYRDMQLAYRNSLPKTVIENINQINFGKRKEIDRLSYKMKIVSKQLIDLKLEHAVLEDRIKYESLGAKTALIKQAEIVTGKVQDAILRREAALAINQIYFQMINVMKKDALYFDAILITIRNDGINQSKCMIDATKLGQMATEYLDDRKHEYKTLETIVKKDMKSRKEDLDLIQSEVDNAGNTLRKLLRRDSDVNIGRLEIPYTQSICELQSEMAKLVNSLTILKRSTMVISFELIQPCLQDQLIQEERLKSMVEKSERNKDILVNKSSHADLMSNELKNTMIETTFEYKTQKSELKEAITEQNKKKDDTTKLIKTRYNLAAKMRISFKQLQQMCNMIGKGQELVKRARVLDDDIPQNPVKDEVDNKKIIAEISTKLRLLTSNVQKKFDTSQSHEAFRYYEAMMKDRSLTISTDQVVADESLLEGLELEISHVLTREDIKNESDQIVAANTKEDDILPDLPKKKTKSK